jgi:hypothetical protein
MVQHIPIPRRLIRYFDLYSSKSRSKWKDWDYIARLAPSGWKEQNDIEIEGEEKEIQENCHDGDISTKKSKSTLARLMAKIYEVDLTRKNALMTAETRMS